MKTTNFFKKISALIIAGTIGIYQVYAQGGTAGSGELVQGCANGVDGTYFTYLGCTAGYHNSTGANNSFVGSSCGFTNVSGSNNSYFGFTAGF